jgi:hypothetical protein
MKIDPRHKQNDEENLSTLQNLRLITIPKPDESSPYTPTPNN